MPRNDIKAYTSVIARLPQALANQVKHYASEHGCSVSDLIRAGLELRLAADVPARTPDRSRDSEVLHRVEALAPLLRMQIQDTVRETMTEVLHEVLQRETNSYMPVSEVLQEVLQGHTEVIHGHTSVPKPLEATCSVCLTEVVPRAEVMQGYTEEGCTEVIPFDSVKYRLGKLCPRNHHYHGTGQSLRTNNKAGYCLACNAEDARARRQAKRQEVSA